MQMTLDQKVKDRRSVSEHYISHIHNDFKALYWDDLPIDPFVQSYDVFLRGVSFEWKGNGTFEELTITEQSLSHGQSIELYSEACDVTFQFSCNGALMLPFMTKKRIYFTVETDIPNGTPQKIFVKTDEFNLIDSLQQQIEKNQRRFSVDPISICKFNGETYFSYYTSIIRKQRIIHQKESRIGNNTFLEQWIDVHGELAICVSNMLMYYPFLNDMTGRSGFHEGKEYFMPNMGHVEHLYLLWCGSALDRIYNFWESALVVLYSYEQAGFSKMRSFDLYCGELQKRRGNDQFIAFGKYSEHLSWLLNFHQNNYPSVMEMRHRIVHHQFTDEYKGILNAKFALTAHDAVFNKDKAIAMNNEFKVLLSLIKEHFDFCKQGFEEILKLIDELPVKITE